MLDGEIERARSVPVWPPETSFSITTVVYTGLR
jgi:hypothetical protein